MKKFIKILTVLLLVSTIIGCTSNEKKEDENIITVSATLDPHSTILEFAKPILKEKFGYDLEITILDDYFIFNRALDANEVLANYFQHIPFFEGQIAENGYDIVNVGGVHIEPFGLYSNEIKTISELKEGSTIVIGNTVSDHGRILAIFESAGLIKLNPEVETINAVTSDIIENSLNLKFIEIKPELLYTALSNNEGSIVAINGNYALANGLNPIEDALLLEEATNDNPYVNIVATKNGNQDDPRVKALIEVLTSSEVKEFITETYGGSVIPVN